MMLISCRMFSFSFAEYALKNFPAQIFPVFFSTSRKTCPNFPLQMKGEKGRCQPSSPLHGGSQLRPAGPVWPVSVQPYWGTASPRACCPRLLPGSRRRGLAATDWPQDLKYPLFDPSPKKSASPALAPQSAFLAPQTYSLHHVASAVPAPQPQHGSCAGSQDAISSERPRLGRWTSLPVPAEGPVKSHEGSLPQTECLSGHLPSSALASTVRDSRGGPQGPRRVRGCVVL